MSQPITRRTFVASTLAIALSIPVLTREVAAQAGTPGAPAAGLDQLGLPELTVTVTKTGYDGIPASLAAGRYLVTATGEDQTEIAFLQPSGMSMNDFLSALESMQQGGSDDDAIPSFFYDFLLAGGVFIVAGQANQTVIDLPPGEWLAWAADPEAAQGPVSFTVTGEMPTDLPAPQANAAITFSDFAFELTAGDLVAGENIIEINNAGSQPHFMTLFRGPDTLTKAELGARIDADMTGTPVAPGVEVETNLLPLMDTSLQSRGTRTWLAYNLELGTYAALCFFPDKKTGMPHAAMGMYNVFQVKDTRVMRVTDEAAGWSYA